MVSIKAIMGRDPNGIFQEGEVHTISHKLIRDVVIAPCMLHPKSGVAC